MTGAVFLLSQLVSIIFSAVSQETTDVAASCADRCDESYFPGRPCYCNEACMQFENCCFDYYSECRPDYVWSEDWVDFGSNSYKFFSDVTATAESARDACFEEGALLASITSSEEQEFLSLQVLRKRTLSAFISGRRNQDGVWMWGDGSTVSLPSVDKWHAWYDGEPGSQIGDDCLVISNYRFWHERPLILDSYIWRTYSCRFNPANQIQGYICERSLQCIPDPCQNNGSCQYVGGQKEFECHCQDSFVGEYCQHQVGEGIWLHCGETHLTESQGVITSPLYPKPYPPKVRCQWLIETLPNQTLSLSLGELALEESKNCLLDKVVVYDGDSTETDRLLPPTCGLLGDNSTESLTSSSNKVLVVMETDDSVADTGFSLSYKTQTCGLGLGDSGCGTRRLFQLPCGMIDVTAGPADSLEPCQWQISVAQGNIIHLAFEKFHIQDTGMECSGGGLNVYDGKDSGAELQGTYCGSHFPWSLISTTSHLFMTLQGLQWADQDALQIHYTTLEDALFNETAEYTMMAGQQGSISLATSTANTRNMYTDTYRWLIRVSPGNKILINMTLTSYSNASVKVYDGFSEFSTSLLDQSMTHDTLYQTETYSVEPSSFQALVVFEHSNSDDQVSFTLDYNEVVWLPEMSGCYRPYYYHQPEAVGTENNPVSALQPAVIMVSQRQGYAEGMYCKWRLSGADSQLLKLAVVDSNISPVTQNCDYDGLVVYDGDIESGTKYGPFCGQQDLEKLELLSTLDHFIVVFYSDTRGTVRPNGTFRAIITTQDTGACAIWQMESDRTGNVEAECGVVLAPGFPGIVPASHWTWLIKSPQPNSYITSQIYYINGPDVADPLCNQFFQLVEIAHDATILRQYETVLFKVCGSESLFVPPRTIKVPPNQKLVIELNTQRNNFDMQWQFKVAFSISFMDKPQYMDDGTVCPDNYISYHGYCYRYYPWVLRHYLPEQYRFQTTWHSSLIQCEQEGGSLLSVHSEDELYFIKYAFAHEWFWDPAAPYTVNHRLVYIGLQNNNLKGLYQWTDGTSSVFADWYKPPEAWDIQPVHADTQVVDLLYLKNSQPTADVGSLCTVMIVNSPFISFKWAKIPCDYPVFRAGAVCKQPGSKAGEGNSTAAPMPSETTRYMNNNTIAVCESGWLKIGRMCYMLYSNYMPYNQTNSTTENLSTESRATQSLPYSQAQQLCTDYGGEVAAVADDDVVQVVMAYLEIWQHSVQVGDIWLLSQTDCNIITVRKSHPQSDEVLYNVISQLCTDLLQSTDNLPANVLCQSPTIVYDEACSIHEYTCDNGNCISVDFLCDSRDDCLDNSDEKDCGCSGKTFQCRNGLCVSVSVYCDGVDNCGDNSDESNCVGEQCGAGFYQCADSHCVPEAAVCDFSNDCLDGSDETLQLCDGRCQGFLCFSGTCLPPSLKGDMISDCPGLTMEDEQYSRQDYTIFDLYSINGDTDLSENENVSTGCDQPYKVQCESGESLCYHRADTCHYDTYIIDDMRQFEVQTACRNGVHLRTKCSMVECPGMYHCPDSYCLPYHKLCDGTPDCPTGHDELHCHNYTCPGMLKCRGSNVCVSHTEVCDGVVQCPMSREDEKYCGDIDIICAGCSCQGHVADCQHRDLSEIAAPSQSGTRNLRAILLAGNQVTLSETTFLYLHWLTRLSLQDNGMINLPENVFIDLKNLLELDLSYNSLTVLPTDLFTGLQSLRQLNLANNKLVSLQKESLAPLNSLHHLILTSNTLESVKEDAFLGVPSLKILDSDAFKFCCIATQVEVCSPEADEFSSCEDLMANYVLQVTIWVLGCLAFAGNIFVIFWRLKTDRKKVSSFFIINLGMSDFLMGVYMVIIASVDVHYRGVYILYADSWRSGVLCQIAGVLAMLSSEVSVFMLTAITMDRVINIMFPLKVGSFRLIHARIVVLCGWITCFILSVLPLMAPSYFGDSFFGRTGVCLPFQITNDKVAGWEYSVFIFLVVNLLSFMAILTGYILIFIHVKRAMKEIGAKSTSTANEYQLAKKLAIIVATDFICWVPIILIGFAALGGAPVSPQVSAWVAVFILPLNSAMNPILYTISAINFSKAKKGRASKSAGYSTQMSTVSQAVTSEPNGQANGDSKI